MALHIKELAVTEISEGEWAIAKGEREGFPIIYRYRPSIDPRVCKSDYATMVVISWQFEGRENGFPDQPTNEQQQELEDLLDWLDTPENSYLTQVVTCNGSKEWLWYVKDCNDWMGKLNQSLSDKSAFPIGINFYDDPEWNTYNGFIKWVS
nr:DUF695 domain-containing protein [Thalassolituus sp. ST750PaO-4]